MSNNKQSSVEWLFDNLNLCFDKFDNGEYSYTEFVNASNEIKEQAKAMHKEEVERAWRNGDGIFDLTSDIFAEKYYNKMFTNPNDEKL